MRVKLAVAGIAAAMLAVGGVTLASAHPAGSSHDHGVRVIKVFALTVQSASLDLGDPGFSLGDQQVFADDLYDHKGGTKVGTDGVVCTIVRITDASTGSGTAQCLATASLADGQLTTQGFISFTGNALPAPFQNAITGGTGAYANARGQITVEELSDTESNITAEVRIGKHH
jgi:Allene oxide cyclase barrel like domain